MGRLIGTAEPASSPVVEWIGPIEIKLFRTRVEAKWGDRTLTWYPGYEELSDEQVIEELGLEPETATELLRALGLDREFKDPVFAAAFRIRRELVQMYRERICRADEPTVIEVPSEKTLHPKKIQVAGLTFVLEDGLIFFERDGVSKAVFTLSDVKKSNFISWLIEEAGVRDKRKAREVQATLVKKIIEERKTVNLPTDLTDEVLFEYVNFEGKPALAAWDGERLQIVKKDLDEDFPFPLPGVPDRFDDDPTLWQETREYIKSYYDNPDDDRVYDVMTAAVAWSYLVQHIKQSTPFLLFLGPWRSGKTRALEVMAALCHRAMLVVDPSEASIFRLVERFHPTLVIDEAHIINVNVRAIMAAAYRYGLTVSRVVDPEDEVHGVKLFHVFSFIIYAMREEPPSDILSRSIVIHCEKNVRQTQKRLDQDVAAQLRTRWFAQRLRLWNKVKVNYERLVSDDGRLQELFSPLLTMAEIFGGPAAVGAIEGYARRIEQELHELEKSSPEAALVEAVINLVEQSPGDAPDWISVEELVDQLNRELPRQVWSPEKVGRRMTALGFRREKRGGKRGYLVDLSLLERLKRRYLGIGSTAAPHSAVSSAHPFSSELGVLGLPETTSAESATSRTASVRDAGWFDVHVFHTILLPLLQATRRKDSFRAGLMPADGHQDVAEHDLLEQGGQTSAVARRSMLTDMPDDLRPWIAEVHVGENAWSSYIECICGTRLHSVTDLRSHIEGWHQRRLPRVRIGRDGGT